MISQAPAFIEEAFRRRALFVVILCASAVIALFVVWEARMIVLILFSGFLGALLLTTLAGWFSAWLGIRYSISYAALLFTIGATAVFFIWLRGPALVQQFSTLQVDIPEAAHSVAGNLQKYNWGRWTLAHGLNPNQIAQALSWVATGIGGFVLSGLAVVAGLVLAVITSLYLAAEPEFYLRAFRRVLPRAHRVRIDACLRSALHVLRSWLFAKFVSMAAIGFIISTGLWILGVPLAGTLGIIAALLTFVPNLGAVLSVLLAGLFAFAISPGKGVLTVLLFCVAHFLEGNLVTPLAERNIARLPPVITLSAQLLLGSVAGALGVAMAAPLSAAVLGVMKEVFRASDEPPFSDQSGSRSGNCDASSRNLDEIQSTRATVCQ